MSCGSVTAPSTISVTFPAVRLVSAEPPAIPWRAFLHGARAHAKRFAQRRRQRLALLELDDRLLADIGVPRADALVEARKPFWRELSGGKT
jgi:uncharacterized protein YjiS (DUF1127 family)